MPTYEYRCEKGHTFEQIQKMNDRPLTKCPVCGAKAARVISGGQGLIFKGSGFYITDYGKDGKGPRKDAGAGSADAPPAAAKPDKSEKSDSGASAPSAPAADKKTVPSTKPKKTDSE
ncbi:MAG TPA: zinc ribbon domain-containing protein [Gemmatimonadales bacterium]|jgi:putative FmdB family regulatory protein|nr:zinc ribbon domain-containing protein [Gemmatimonadales bacterium]